MTAAKLVAWLPVFALLFLISIAAACDDESPSADADADVDGDGDGDSDGDGDADGDADSDADGDSDGDGDADTDGDGDVEPQTPFPERYPADRTHSPITPYVSEGFTDIAANGVGLQANVMAKVGDSITDNDIFLSCLASDLVDLDGRDELQTTIEHFNGGVVEGESPFERRSVAALVGRTASWVMDGSPSPIEQELSAVSPQFAVVMFGTNDMGWFGYNEDTLDWFAGHMLDLIDFLVEQGVVPLMSSIPPRGDSVTADEWVPRFNTAIRGLAQAVQVPFHDYHRELLSLPDRGLSGDGVHPSVDWSLGGPGACRFNAEGLAYGFNVRNLVVLESLDRTRRAFRGEPAPDIPTTPLLGDGSPETPYLIEELPFTDLRTTLISPHRAIDVYEGCDSSADESGPELYYELDLAFTTTVRAMVLDRGEVDIDVHVLDESATAAGCIARGHRAVVETLEPGRYFIVADSFVSSGSELSGEYLLVVMED